MTNIIKVSKGAGVAHVLTAYKDTHSAELIEGTALFLSELKRHTIIVYDTNYPTRYYTLTPKEVPNEPS